MTRTRLKVCCIADPQEAGLALLLGADAVGLVSAMPSGPGPISDDQIARIAASIPPPIASFLLTCRTDAGEIVAQARTSGCNTLQLVDHVPADQWPSLRAALPGVRLVQVIHVVDKKALSAARLAAGHADAILLDSGNPSLAVKELGGTGRRHDWGISRQIVLEVQEGRGVPVFLAGGLHAGNVAEAVRTVRPFAVDVCSGVRSDGRLDPSRLRQFVEALGSAWTPRM